MISHPVNPAVILSATPTDTVSQIRPISAVNPVPDATQSDTPAFTLGQKYMAQMGERLANGHSMVNVAGRWLQMRMPAAVDTGDLLELTLIEQSPRLKFLLHTDTPAGSNSNPATLSPAGKLIAQLLSQPSLPTSKAAGNPAPLLPTPPVISADKAQLPGQLQQALAISGLFYEAHLARWLNGKRSLQQLQQEPQGKLLGPTIATASTSTALVTPEAASLVQQQLHTLETGTIQWRGEVWPGQAMEWDITEYPGNHQEKEQADGEITGKSGRWQTRIHLHLPNLGKITATLMIDPQGMRIRLDADSDNITQQLKKEQMALANAMQVTGLTIRAMEIQRHEES
ncbi:hook-length control protein FliK [Nitrosomonas eutropha]|uniref:flagellar hook-length control protein FliK n=1 Tax=Nitrosomonas TaxID=914 RepID=UPI00087F251D|nr:MULTISPECIES: flagellar hook-length control protein FliK [Nitrosomonas]MXS80808.1 flagellar hook-length control protein FliK [Nitrosomonas sp. GH22]SCX24529.1 hook-length control protein FliK [Nitrosomonas eutropha]SDW41460.1 hook-length control protein FliK [Nitrosomonas eutropha]